MSVYEYALAGWLLDWVGWQVNEVVKEMTDVGSKKKKKKADVLDRKP